MIGRNRLGRCDTRGERKSLADRVLGAGGVQRERAAHTLLATLTYVVFALLQQAEVRAA